jgi:hypothetical protein
MQQAPLHAAAASDSAHFPSEAMNATIDDGDVIPKSIVPAPPRSVRRPATTATMAMAGPSQRHAAGVVPDAAMALSLLEFTAKQKNIIYL